MFEPCTRKRINSIQVLCSQTIRNTDLDVPLPTFIVECVGPSLIGPARRVLVRSRDRLRLKPDLGGSLGTKKGEFGANQRIPLITRLNPPDALMLSARIGRPGYSQSNSACGKLLKRAPKFLPARQDLVSRGTHWSDGLSFGSSGDGGPPRSRSRPSFHETSPACCHHLFTQPAGTMSPRWQYREGQDQGADQAYPKPHGYPLD